MDTSFYTLPESVRGENDLIATYHIILPKDVDILKKASALAAGQTIGTWVPVPGITDEIRQKYMGRVIGVFDAPPTELSTMPMEDQRQYLIRIAYPAENFGDDFPLMITSLLGNDASTSAQVKLMDIEFPEEFIRQFAGPRYGIEGIRSLTGVKNRPLLLNMIKPCTGLTPEKAADIFYQTALGGVDFIKDDELLGNPSYSSPWERVKLFKKCADAAYEQTGIHTRYFVNVTCGVKDLLENIRRVEDAGADGIMINYAAVGYSTLRMAAQNTNLPILGHSAGVGMFSEGPANGMASPLAVAKLARIAGADMVMINTPYGGYPLMHQKYMQTVGTLIAPFYDLKPSMPTIGGGVHPGMVQKYINEVGTDIVLAAGGAIQGHPDGAAAGVRAMRQAVEISLSGEDFMQAASSYEELTKALALWSYQK